MLQVGGRVGAEVYEINAKHLSTKVEVEVEGGLGNIRWTLSKWLTMMELYSVLVEKRKGQAENYIVCDYNNSHEARFIKCFEEYGFESTVFNQTTVKQSNIYISILQDAYTEFVTCKPVLVQLFEQSRCTNFIRLPIRKK